MRHTIMRFPGFRERALTLSYDDGVRQDKRLIKLLDSYGIKCTFNINSELFTMGGDRMTQEEAVQTYSGSGHEIAVHGAVHLSLADYDGDMGARDVIVDRENLEKLFGRIVKGMAYANGSYDDGVVETLRTCGIKYARTTVSTESFDIPTDWLKLPATCHHNNPRLGELAEKFLSEGNANFRMNKPRLFYLWGHSYEFDRNDNWQVIENFCKTVGGKDEVWYATNGEIYDYVKAFEKLEWSVNGAIIYNPTCTDVYLIAGGKKTLVKGGETVKLW